jgi:hypothetical protein
MLFLMSPYLSVVALDTLAACAALCNAAYFAAYGRRSNGDRARRMGAAALALVGAAAFADAASSQALLWTGAAQVPAGLWALARALPCAAAVCISLIVARRLVS